MTRVARAIRIRHITPTVVALAALANWENPDYLWIAAAVTAISTAVAAARALRR